MKSLEHLTHGSRYFDKEGGPLTLEDWSVLFEDEKYKIVKQEHVDGHFVSTVWLGLNHSFLRDAPPLIFETMIFTEDERGGEKMWRYSTLEDALAGHDKAVQELKEGKLIKETKDE